MTYGRVLLLGFTAFVAGGAIGGRWGGYLAVAAFVGTPLAALAFWLRHPGGVKEGDAVLAAVEVQDEEVEPESRWERKQRLVARWHPASLEQATEVRRLAKEHSGALVRVRADRAAEVLTASKAELLRYEVGADGTAQIVEQAARDTTGRKLGLGGLALVVLGWAVAGLGHKVGVGLWVGGFLVLWLAFVISGSDRSEHGALLRTRRGERWTSIGYPED